LRAEASGVNNVHFLGFQQRDELACIMGLATALVLPTHSDPWGLVVNEAMACGLPVIVSQVAGCAADLVRPGWNGFLVKPHDRRELSTALEKIAQNEKETLRMAQNSLLHIRNFSPQACAGGISSAALAFKEAAACA
jgi:glycosyltransferase involved in cell wall biosynthesis